jgi:hypothetical protein
MMMIMMMMMIIMMMMTMYLLRFPNQLASVMVDETANKMIPDRTNELIPFMFTRQTPANLSVVMFHCNKV